MANCFLCGILIDSGRRQLRRRVKTGGIEQIRFGRDRAVSARTSYGMRIVCTRCAKSIDEAKRREVLLENWKLFGAVILLVAVALARMLHL